MPAERLDRKVTVILATDVAAYSKHVEQDDYEKEDPKDILQGVYEGHAEHVEPLEESQ